MPNPDAFVPNNAVSNVLSELSAMRGVNQQLRAAERKDEPPPLSDDDIVADFARSTGTVINTNGEEVGKVCPAYAKRGDERIGCASCGWPPEYHGGVSSVTTPAAGPRFPDNPQAIAAIAEKGNEMFGRKPKPFVPGTRFTFDQIQGVNLLDGTVLIDGFEFALEPEESTNVARFCIQVLMKNIEKQIDAMAKAYGIQTNRPPEGPTKEAPNGDVPAVPPGEPPAGSVPPPPGQP